MSSTTYRLFGWSLVIFLLGMATAVNAKGHGVLQELLSGSAELPSPVSVRNLDDMLERLKRSGKAAETLNKEMLAKVGKGKTPQELKTLRKRWALNQLKQYGKNDPVLISQIQQMDQPTMEAMALLAKGGAELASNVPDVWIRSQLLKQGGAPLLEGAALYGKKVVRPAMRFQMRLDSGKLRVLKGKSSVDLEDFVATITRHGKASIHFFNEQIAPHWKTWVSTGLLAWWVADPDYFQNTVGDLTRKGAAAVSELAGTLIGNAVMGTVEGGGKALNRFWWQLLETVEQQGLMAVIMVLGLLFGIALLLPGVRRRLRNLFKLRDTGDHG